MDRCVCLEIIIAKFQEVKVACDFEKHQQDPDEDVTEILNQNI
jgi:hypothetical protein